jgi:hypothetical protein
VLFLSLSDWLRLVLFSMCGVFFVWRINFCQPVGSWLRLCYYWRRFIASLYGLLFNYCGTYFITSPCYLNPFPSQLFVWLRHVLLLICVIVQPITEVSACCIYMYAAVLLSGVVPMGFWLSLFRQVYLIPY